MSRFPFKRTDAMKSYQQLVRTILERPEWQENRTNIRTKVIPGAHLEFDLSEGDPITTTKKLAFKSVVGELVGLLRGVESAADFRALGCNVWNQNANENAEWLASPYRRGEDDLGPIYGSMWRRWPAYKTLVRDSAQYHDALARGYLPFGNAHDGRAILFKEIDQLRDCLDTLVSKPSDRRILFHAWNPAALDSQALPACHLLYGLTANVKTRELTLHMTQRSVDTGLGLPFNLASMAAMLHLFARLTGFKARKIAWTGYDVHIYENQVPMLEEQLSREPRELPRLVISDRVPAYADTGLYMPEWLDLVEPTDFRLENYDPHPALKAAMAV
jgi:thymidylate synthase